MSESANEWFNAVSATEAIFIARTCLVFQAIAESFKKLVKKASGLTVLKRSCKEATWYILRLTSLNVHSISRCFTVKG